MFAYNDSTCNGGSLTDAFQYAAERGITAESGEWGQAERAEGASGWGGAGAGSRLQKSCAVKRVLLCLLC